VPRVHICGRIASSCRRGHPSERVVTIHAEGKEHAVGIGITKMSTEEIKKVNKGIAVDTVTFLGDDLWAVKTL
jgi:PUA domain protein